MTARLVIMGPQGAGKGTQAARLAERLGVPAISTGDIFRANIKGGTELGVLAQSYTAKGELVPDSVTNDMVRDRLAQPDAADGFILDGYPRNAAQVVELDGILASHGVALDAVVELTAHREELLARLQKRAQVDGHLAGRVCTRLLGDEPTPVRGRAVDADPIRARSRSGSAMTPCG